MQKTLSMPSHGAAKGPKTECKKEKASCEMKEQNKLKQQGHVAKQPPQEKNTKQTVTQTPKTKPTQNKLTQNHY